jgi:cell division inhibitor SulA/protein ImuA
MNALSSILSHPAVWRGAELGRVTTPSVPSGYAELDAELPGGGWPTAALTEILPQHAGIGELRILGHALANLAAQGRWLAWIAPPYLPYAPALQAAGIDLARLMVIRTRTPRETLWAIEQTLRSQTCGAVLAWPDKIAYAELRRLQLAAEGSNTLAVLFRSQRCITEATPAALRLRLDTQGGALAARILKRRGGVLGRSITLTPPPVVERSACFTNTHTAINSNSNSNFNLNGKNHHAVDRPAFPAPAARSLRAGFSLN